MARIQLGSIVSDIRGKVGDQIYSRNAHGLYVKGYAVPTGEPSIGMIAARSRMAVISGTWRTLTEAQRNQWIVRARDFSYKSKRWNGESITGFNLFVRTNMYRSVAGLSLINVPGSISLMPSIKPEVTYPWPPAVEGEITWLKGSSNWWLFVYCTIDYSRSVNSPNVSPYKFLFSQQWFVNNDPRPFNFTNNWEDVYGGELPASRNFFERIDLVNIVSGQKAPSYYLKLQTRP